MLHPTRISTWLISVDWGHEFEDEMMKHHSENQGRIRVRVQRVNVRNLRKSRTAEYRDSGSRLSDGPKELIKEIISHTMKVATPLNGSGVFI